MAYVNLDTTNQAQCADLQWCLQVIEIPLRIRLDGPRRLHGLDSRASFLQKANVLWIRLLAPSGMVRVLSRG